jgi:hypothetical protein
MNHRSMHRIQNRLLPAMLVLLYVAIVPNMRAQQPQRKALRDSRSMGIKTAKSVLDKDLLDVYARIMGYQGAGLAVKESKTGNKSGLKDRLTITVSDMRSGEMGELAQIMDRVMAEQSEEVLKIEREKMCRILGSCDLIYHATWAKGSGKAEKSPSLNGVDHYTVYTVTLSYQGKSRTHQGLMLYYKSGKTSTYKIVDGLISSINEMTQDNLPQARPPLNQYAESKRNGTTRDLRKKQDTNDPNCPDYCVDCHVDGWSPAEYGIVGMQIPVYVWAEGSYYHIPRSSPKTEWHWTSNSTLTSSTNNKVYPWDLSLYSYISSNFIPWWGNTFMVTPETVGTLTVSTTASGIKMCTYSGASNSGSLTVYDKLKILEKEPLAGGIIRLIDPKPKVLTGSGPISYAANPPYPSVGSYTWTLTNTTAGTLKDPITGQEGCNGRDCNFTAGSSGTTTTINVTFYPFSGHNISTTASQPLSIVDQIIVLEPINTLGANPAFTSDCAYTNCSGLEVNHFALYEVNVDPVSFSDDNIIWSKASGSGSGSIDFKDGNNKGRHVSIKGIAAGDFKLEVDIGSATPKPYIKGRVLEDHKIVNINYYIVRKDDGTSPATTPTAINAQLDNVNKIFTQAGIEFLNASITYINKNDWLSIPLKSDNYATLHLLTSTGVHTSGLEVYYVNELEGAIHGITDRSYTAGAGITLRSDASARDLAHEIGHTCGLDDLYIDQNGTIIPDHLVQESELPDDWSGGDGTGYYSYTLTYEFLIHRLLMFGISWDWRWGDGDIPLGRVYGVDHNGNLGMIKVGHQDMTRQPISW